MYDDLDNWPQESIANCEQGKLLIVWVHQTKKLTTLKKDREPIKLC